MCVYTKLYVGKAKYHFLQNVDNLLVNANYYLLCMYDLNDIASCMFSIKCASSYPLQVYLLV